MVGSMAHGGVWSYLCLTWAAAIIKLSGDICVPEGDHLSCSDHDSNLEISADDVYDELSDKVYADCAPPLQMTSENEGLKKKLEF